MKLSILIPVYNEAQFIGELIRRVRCVELPVGITEEIIIVDDGSTDETPEILKRYNADTAIKIYRQNKNMGKSAAVKTGIEKSEGDIILIQDADLEYDPDNYPMLIEPIIKNKADVVYGSRFKGKIEKMALINRIANLISNITLNLLYGAKISDVNTCHKAFKREVFDKIKITSENFTFETEITAKLLNLGYEIYEMPIKYTARSKEEGKKITWLKAWQMYWGIIRYKLGSSNNQDPAKNNQV